MKKSLRLVPLATAALLALGMSSASAQTIYYSKDGTDTNLVKVQTADLTGTFKTDYRSAQNHGWKIVVQEDSGEIIDWSKALQRTAKVSYNKDVLKADSTLNLTKAPEYKAEVKNGQEVPVTPGETKTYAQVVSSATAKVNPVINKVEIKLSLADATDKASTFVVKDSTGAVLTVNAGKYNTTQGLYYAVVDANNGDTLTIELTSGGKVYTGTVKVGDTAVQKTYADVVASATAAINPVINKAEIKLTFKDTTDKAATFVVKDATGTTLTVNPGKYNTTQGLYYAVVDAAANDALTIVVTDGGQTYTGTVTVGGGTNTGGGTDNTGGSQTSDWSTVVDVPNSLAEAAVAGLTNVYVQFKDSTVVTGNKATVKVNGVAADAKVSENAYVATISGKAGQVVNVDVTLDGKSYTGTLTIK